jgi:hypothetical protein
MIAVAGKFLKSSAIPEKRDGERKAERFSISATRASCVYSWSMHPYQITSVHLAQFSILVYFLSSYHDICCFRS